tara:strand:+ start:293 stop:412 length:120 start_codon:yes stop_codon:yes gene_type:complete
MAVVGLAIENPRVGGSIDSRIHALGLRPAFGCPNLLQAN